MTYKLIVQQYSFKISNTIIILFKTSVQVAVKIADYGSNKLRNYVIPLLGPIDIKYLINVIIL